MSCTHAKLVKAHDGSGNGFRAVAAVCWKLELSFLGTLTLAELWKRKSARPESNLKLLVRGNSITDSDCDRSLVLIDHALRWMQATRPASNIRLQAADLRATKTEHVIQTMRLGKLSKLLFPVLNGFSGPEQLGSPAPGPRTLNNG